MVAVTGALAILASIGVLTSVIKLIEHKIKHRNNNNKQLQNRFTLRINGVEYYFHESDIDKHNSAYEVAIDFCRKEGSQFGLSIESFHLCTEPIVEALQHHTRRSNQKQNGKLNSSEEDPDAPWEINLRPTDTSSTTTVLPKEKTTNVVHDQDFNKEITSDSSQISAENQVENDKQRNFDSSTTINPKQLELPLEVNGVTYLFEYEDPVDYVIKQHEKEYVASADEKGSVPQLHPAVQQERQVQYLRNMAQQLAELFCNQHGEALLAAHIQQQNQIKPLDRESRNRLLVEGCRLPVQQSLMSQMQQQMQQMQRRVAAHQNS